MHKRIVIPIDVSNPEPGSKSCPVARDMAKASGATIKLVSVLPGYNFSMVASFFPEDAQEKMKAKVLEDLRKIGEKYFDEAPEVSVSTGKRAREILAAAADWNADLIIFGCRPKDALGGEPILGSVGIALAERAKCNVFVAR